MKSIEQLVYYIELHSAEGIRECFNDGIDANDIYKNEPLIYELTSEYTRSPRFKDCIRAYVDHGLKFEDKALLSVLLDDAEQLNFIISHDTSVISKKYSLRCAYTPLRQVSLLHIAAEFNHTGCATTLVKHGADINARAGFEKYGFGGQTPIFHTVNQNSNQSYEMLQFLLAHNAYLNITVPGIIWGEGYEWETLIPAVNPISYAMMGLLPQMHRDEKTITDIVSVLLKHQYGIEYTAANVPNAYLKK